MTMRLHDKEKI